MKELIDSFGRVHDYLRVSITDKCNLNCFYCNPSERIQQKLQRNEILSYAELFRLIKLFVSEFGFKKIRITGGEPFARKGIMDFLFDLSELREKNPFLIGITTNGILLDDKLTLLKKYGIENLNISLDSLNRERFNKITGSDSLDKVLTSINKALDEGFEKIKINTVVMRGINDDELLDFAEFGKEKKLNIRFIEYMPFTDNSWSRDNFISYSEMKENIEKDYFLKTDNENSDSAGITKDYKIEGSECKISFISSVSEHFCGKCNRLRITSEGKMRLCLFSQADGLIDLKSILRNNAADDKLVEVIEKKLNEKNYKHPDADELSSYEGNFMKGIGG